MKGLIREKPFKPARKYCPTDVPMDSETTMRLSYQPVEIPVPQEKPWTTTAVYHPPVIPVDDNTTYNLRYLFYYPPYGHNFYWKTEIWLNVNVRNDGTIYQTFFPNLTFKKSLNFMLHNLRLVANRNIDFNYEISPDFTCTKLCYYKRWRGFFNYYENCYSSQLHSTWHFGTFGRPLHTVSPRPMFR